MSYASIPMTRPASLTLNRWVVFWGVMILVTVLLMLSKESLPWAFKYPRAWQIPLAGWITGFMKWLINSFDLGLFTFKEFTRWIALLVEQPYTLVKSLLSTGFLSGVGSDAVQVFPRISWVALVAGVMLFGHYVRDWKLALLVGGCFGYLVVFGQWDSAMVTLSSIIIAVPVGVVGGVLLGIFGHRSHRFRMVLVPILDLMQTVPVFAYLVPVLLLFGFSPVSAMIATIIYAMPPMVRVTLLALEHITTEIVEAGSMAGCMLSLNMVIIASMIGAGGLGHDVLTALRRLRIGEGVEAGVAITLLAIALDRLSQAYANRPPPRHSSVQQSLWRRHPHAILFVIVVSMTWLLGIYLPALSTYPESWQITTGSFWGDLVRYINVNYFDALESIKNFLLLNIMVPFKRFLLSLPWIAVVAMVGLGGWQLGGWRLGLLTASMTTFIAVVGLWAKAMVTLYLCGLSVIIACLIGIPIGILAARNERVHRVVSVVIDTLQTLPSFVYLMPVVMLFRVGDFAAMLAVVAYAITPIIRYTDHGIRHIAGDLIEAGRQVGMTRGQLLRKVQIPMALPHIMLGVNQTIMMALSMLVITALVGTRELGQEVYIALTKADTGRGIIAGVCVAFIAIISDRMINAWASRRKREYGLE
jgi:glycine betaine/proline transport system permease protein